MPSEPADKPPNREPIAEGRQPETGRAGETRKPESREARPAGPSWSRFLVRWAWLAGMVVGAAFEVVHQKFGTPVGNAGVPSLYEAYWPDGRWLTGLWVANGLVLGLCGGTFVSAIMGMVFGSVGGAVFASAQKTFLAMPGLLGRWAMVCIPGAIAAPGTAYSWGLRGADLLRAAGWGALCVLVGLGAERIFVVALHPLVLSKFAGSKAAVSFALDILDTAINNALLVGLLAADLARLKLSAHRLPSDTSYFPPAK